jgi:hypothetical protein
MRPLTLANLLLLALPLTAADDPEPPDPKANCQGQAERAAAGPAGGEEGGV